MKRFLLVFLFLALLGCHKNDPGPGPITTCTPPDGWTAAVYLELNPDVAADLYFGQNPLQHWCSSGMAEGRPWKKPGLIGEIKDFVRLPESDNDTSIYFGVGKCAGTIYFGEYGYQNGDHSSTLFQYPHTAIQSFDAESVFDIREFKGKCYLTVEHGRYKEGVDKAMVYQLQGTVWKEVYRHPSWNLMIHLHVHGDHLYATGSKIDDRSDPAGAVRTSDGVNWEIYYENPYEYRLWGMTSLGNDIWFAATSSGMDYGGNNCNPAVFKNKALMWRDTNSVNEGFWGIAAFKNDIFLGQTGSAKVVRFSDKKVVLSLPSYIKFHKLLVDEASNTLYAFSAMPDGATNGALVYSTKDGNTWTNVGGMFAVPQLFFAYYDPVTFHIWVTGGKFSQDSGGYGRIYRSVR